MFTAEEVLQIKNLSVYQRSNLILENVSFSIARGDPFAIVGESGSGKSTLLMTALGLITPESGQVQICKLDIARLTPSARAHLAGLVFQDFQLFPHLSVIQNIELAPRYHRLPMSAEKAQELLEHLNIASLKDRYIHELSGGQKQRVAIARSLILEPKILFFDEPSSALDPETTRDLAVLLKNINEKTQVVIVSHDRNFIDACCTRGIRLKDKKLYISETLKGLWEHTQHE